MLKKYLNDLYIKTAFVSRDNITEALSEVNKNGYLLDVGCWDGEVTQEWADAVSTEKVYGIELVKKAALKAKKKGIKVAATDIDKSTWPYPGNKFDYVISNLVIEHLADVDHFILESYRVLKKGGITIVSTNNLASWHNIICLFMGWAPFDLTNTSFKRWSIGNPMAIHSNEASKFGKTFTHKCIYTERWLKEWYGLYKFKHIKTYGAGYYPLSPVLGKVDKLHCALITMLFKK